MWEIVLDSVIIGGVIWMSMTNAKLRERVRQMEDRYGD